MFDWPTILNEIFKMFKNLRKSQKSQLMCALTEIIVSRGDYSVIPRSKARLSYPVFHSNQASILIFDEKFERLLMREEKNDISIEQPSFK